MRLPSVTLTTAAIPLAGLLFALTAPGASQPSFETIPVPVRPVEVIPAPPTGFDLELERMYLGRPRPLRPQYYDWRHPGSNYYRVPRGYYGRRWQPGLTGRGYGRSGYWYHLRPDGYQPGYYFNPHYGYGYRLYRHGPLRLRDHFRGPLGW